MGVHYKKIACILLVIGIIFCTACSSIDYPEDSSNVVFTTTHTTTQVSSSTSTTDDGTPTETSFVTSDIHGKTEKSTIIKTKNTSSTSYINQTTATTHTKAPTVSPNTTTAAVVQDEEALKHLDFLVRVETGRDVRVLQLTDTQIMSLDDVEEQCFSYIRRAIERTKPDFIFISGDLVYGQYDDDGAILTSLISFMDSFEIPWTGVWGNHDNESLKGAKWQCEQMENSPYCLFSRNDAVNGNSDFSIGIVQGGQLVRVFYMLDSNYCQGAYDPQKNGVLSTTHGITKPQIVWMQESMEKIQTANDGQRVPTSICHHIPSMEFVYANSRYLEQCDSFTLHMDLKGDALDFGSIREDGGIKTPFTARDAKGLTYLELLKKYGVDSVFCGHSHRCNTSVLWEGIRWTFGLKTGTYDRYNKSELGGTLITFNEKELMVKHVYHDLTHDLFMNSLQESGYMDE